MYNYLVAHHVWRHVRVTGVLSWTRAVRGLDWDCTVLYIAVLYCSVLYISILRLVQLEDRAYQGKSEGVQEWRSARTSGREEKNWQQSPNKIIGWSLC